MAWNEQQDWLHVFSLYTAPPFSINRQFGSRWHKQKKMKRLILYLLALPVLWLFVACANDNDEANLAREDWYFDGTLYYEVTSNSPHEVSVSKAEEDVITVNIPSNVQIDGTNYKVTSIADDAFWGCRSLTSIDIPSSVTSIGVGAFRYCSSLTSITIPNSVTDIGDEAFLFTSLTSIEIPNSVTSITIATFAGCSSLTSIRCKGMTPPKASRSTINSMYYDGSIYSITTLYVPKGALDAYKSASYWNRFQNIVEE